MNDEHLIPLLERYAASRDPALRDELFEHYLPLARAVARKFSGRGVETEDLEQVAGMALLKALERFDPARGFRFVTYAVPTITGDVRNYLRDTGTLVSWPGLLPARQERPDAHAARHAPAPLPDDTGTGALRARASANAYRCGTVRAHGNRARGVPGFACPAHAK